MTKVVAITGGAQGIGRAVAMLFARHGYLISIADTDKDAGFELIRMIRMGNGKAMFMCMDVSDEEMVRRWINLTVADFGQIDVLINNAGISRNAPMLDLSIHDFDKVMAVNARGTFLCSQHAARFMRKNKQGSIINIVSTRALMSEPGTEAYSASKGAILALTHAMAVSLGPLGIRVNAISPGWIETADWQYSERARTPVHSEQDRLQHPVCRVGQPDDIANACLFLAESKAGFITGQNLIVDGGMTVKMIYV